MRRILTLVATLTAATVPSAIDSSPSNDSVPQQVTTAQQSTAAQRESVSITVYNQNFGLVRELRTLDLPSGRVSLEYGDVASGIQPETVHIRPIGGRGLQVLEQNYQFDLLNPQKLLEKYVGRMVNVYRTNPQTGEEQVVEAEVLSVNGGPILRIGDEITFNYPGRFGFPEVPDNLIAEPTLLWRLDAGGGDQQVEVSYLTQSMNWKSDYVMVLNEDDDEAGLTGWVTLTNQSGTSYEGAQLQLVAGDVQRVQNNMAPAAMRRAMMADAVQESAGFSEESFFEYHLYTLGRPADLMNNEQKQVTLLEAEQFGVDKRLIFHGATHYYRGQYGQVTSNQKVGVFLDFENSERNGLGMPLPKGVVRVYKRDGSGAQQFIGEDLIDHTPRDETLRIKMGEAFDVVGDRLQMDYDVISNCVSESTWQIDLRNHKDEDVEVMLVEPVGGDWQILSSSHEYSRTDAWTFTMSPTVPANGETTVRYRVRVRWC
ncbi:MAG: DUF4139 domain-containing protein [Gemmatimonadota bacterium]|nr:DUF4139 domain-containing protein [Gemmatimonadota bacterium]MDH3421943.1 DUF4139 domain-containing protein [Gemmatimonadota bacterium]